MQNFSRRQVLKLLAGTGAAITVSTMLTGCAAALNPQRLSTVKFTHGVASGDPTLSSVILWTRAVPQAEGLRQATIRWELASDEAFTNIIRSGHVTTCSSCDFTAKVDVQELPEGQNFFYRFIGEDTVSSVGRAKLIKRRYDQLNLAVFSCSNYPAGYFNVYQHAATDDSIDAVLHLGDYIYEYGAGGYATEGAEELGRTYPKHNDQEIISLTDYRNRYALYRSDPDLQALHAHAPFIVVWDDHEVTNDTWHSGAQNHQPETEGDFFERRAAAIQAYYEWMPIRPPKGDSSLQIYRTFNFGELADLIMLDTRIIGRDQQLAYANYMDPETGAFDQKEFTKAMRSDRTILGKAQFQWLLQELEKSTAEWQVLGQQLLMARMMFPAAVLATANDRTAIAPLLKRAALSKQKLRRFADERGLPSLAAAAEAMRAAPNPPLTPEELALVTNVTPYNLDAWDGYPVERERLLQAAQKMQKPLVVLAGDTHNAWHSQLTTADGTPVGVELATSSVTSPGMESYLSLDSESAKQLAQALPEIIDDLQYTNLHQRGYMVLNITKQAIDTEWRFVDTIRDRNFRITDTHRFSYKKTRA